MQVMLKNDMHVLFSLETLQLMASSATPQQQFLWLEAVRPCDACQCIQKCSQLCR